MKKTIYALSLLMSLLIAPHFAVAAESSNAIIDNNTRSQDTRYYCWYYCYWWYPYYDYNHFTVTPSEVTMQAGQEYTFHTTGDYGGVQWSALRGSLSNTNGSEIVYTAAAQAGNDTITVTDRNGRSARIQVTVTSAIGTLSITPSNVNINPGEKQVFTVNNAGDAIIWSADSGSFEQKSATQAEYTAPKSSGTYTIVGTDYKTGRTVEATVTVARKLTVTPTEAQIGTAKSQTFSVAGGEEPYIWQVIGKGSLDFEIGNTVKYTAAKSSDEDRLLVMDNKGVTAEVNITVNGRLDAREPIKVIPSVGYMKRGETKTFTVDSGVPPYTARIVDGNGTLSPDTQSEDGRFTYTAGNVEDKDIIIEFSDNSGQTVHAHAYVERKLRVSCFNDQTGQVNIKVSGGTPPYIVETSIGVVEFDPETGISIIHLPNRYGEYDFTVIDSSDEIAVCRIQLKRIVPVILPSIATIAAGETKIFMVTRGTEPYEWAFEGGLLEAQNENKSVVEVTVPKTTGTYELTVEDNAGNKAEATVNVFEPLLISPNSYMVYQGENVTIRFDKKGGAGKCDWVLADLQEVEKADNYLVVRPRTDVEVGTSYTVTCRDQNGDMASADIIVVPPTDKAQIEFEGLKAFYKVGDILSVDLVQKVQTNRFQRLDLWAMIEMPNGQLIYRTPLALAPFSLEPQAFKKSLESSNRRQRILDLEIPPGLGGTYVFYAVYVKEGSNLNKDGITVQRSNMARKKTTLADQ